MNVNYRLAHSYTDTVHAIFFVVFFYSRNIGAVGNHIELDGYQCVYVRQRTCFVNCQLIQSVA